MGNAAPRTAVTNVRVFDGRQLRPPGTVVIEGGRISSAAKSSGGASVTVMYRAGVPILAGTDANAEAGGPAMISHGSSLHHELELLVEAGLTNVDALRAATSRPARYFGLPDRGVIEPGRRADLVLVDRDPLRDITATRSIRHVWCGGAEVKPS
jgi:imidazolonepropionase-like amidohydrolase